MGITASLSGQTTEATPTPATAPSPLVHKLCAARCELIVNKEGFGGSGAPVLAKAIQEARYVLVGEDHATREIPCFVTVVCDLMAKQGLMALALEVGPQAARFVGGTLGKPERHAQMAVLQRRYPSSVAFLNLVDENDLVQHAAEAARSAPLQLWGLDQEFLGSAGWLLDEILATKPGPDATAAITRLRAQEQQAALQARESGDPTKLFLFVVSDKELDQAAAFLQQQGSAAANETFHELVVSHEIYAKNAQGDPDANGQRARLLKTHLHQHLEAATAAGQRGKVLLKFGDWHLYKGINPLSQRDLGAYVAEVAEGQGATSLHIAVLGAKGTRAAYDGYERPLKDEKFVLADDKDYGWLKPAFDHQVQIPGAWTLYDLRRLRFQSLGKVMDAELKSLVYGYDLLVIVPELTPDRAVK